MEKGREQGFTLIELSIVLVIIGLIVAGILVGHDLIRAAELKSVITDEQKYITAVNTFRGKYNELPGDMVDATNIWGTDPNDCPDGASSQTPATTTCNGNGNGLIESEGETQNAPQVYECFRAWQQLANAGLIAGAYSGQPYSPGIPWSYMPGINIPATRIANGGFAWMVFGTGPGNQEAYTAWNAQLSVQYLLLGASDPATGKLLLSLLSPADAMAIDLKIDDGQPASGSILASNTASCMVTGAGPYNLSTGTAACTLLFTVRGW